jgi:hypothetical protein
MTQKEQSTQSSQDLLKNISTRDFLNFGIQHVAYIRPVFVDNKTAYAIHAADGTPLSVMDSINSALVVVRHNDLEPVTVH